MVGIHARERGDDPLKVEAPDRRTLHDSSPTPTLPGGLKASHQRNETLLAVKHKRLRLDSILSLLLVLLPTCTAAVQSDPLSERHCRLSIGLVDDPLHNQNRPDGPTREHACEQAPIILQSPHWWPLQWRNEIAPRHARPDERLDRHTRNRRS